MRARSGPSRARTAGWVVAAVVATAVTSMMAPSFAGTDNPNADSNAATNANAYRTQCTHFVSTLGKDTNPGTQRSRPFRTIQHALDTATAPGDAICVRSGVYDAGISFPASGADGKFITLRNYPGEEPVLTGEHVASNGTLVAINDRSYVRIQGFDIKDWTSSARANAGGIIARGSGSHIEILDNKVHDLYITGTGNTRPIAVWGTSETTPMTDVKIDGNEVYYTRTTDSEALQVSGNVDGFEITNNVVHDTEGALFQIGGGLLPPGWGCSTVQAKNGLVKGNTGYETVWDRTADLAGIYVDGAKNIVVDSNVIHDTGYGIYANYEEYCTSQVGAVISENITIQNNLVYGNRTSGLWIGNPYSHTGNRVVDNVMVRNNTVFQNGTNWEANLGIGKATNVKVFSNIFGDADRVALRDLGAPYTNVQLDYNMYWSYVTHHPETPEVAASKAVFGYGGQTYTGFAAYQAATGQDQHSFFARPLFTQSQIPDFSLLADSPGVNAGSPIAGQYAPTAIDGTARPQGGTPDVGAYER